MPQRAGRLKPRPELIPGHDKPYIKKERVGITPDPELMNWVLERVGPGKRFASITTRSSAASCAYRRRNPGTATRAPVRSSVQ